MGCNEGDTWTNWAGNITVKPFRHCFPTSVEELVAIIQEAESAGRHVEQAEATGRSQISLSRKITDRNAELNRTSRQCGPEGTY